jgi:hypothetical protein
MPTIRYEAALKADAECTWLNQFARKNQSQLGQDGILEKIFDIVGTRNKMCIELGAWDGKKHSNTWEMIAEKNWSGILIESNSERCNDIAVNHNNNPKVKIINTFVTIDGEDTLDSILHKAYCPTAPDFMCIDIDGNDWHVWNSLQKHRPRVVLIEFNPTVPNDVYFLQDPDDDINQGCSLRALIALGKEKGYSLVCVQSFDAFFVLDELYPSFRIRNNDIDMMYDQRRFETVMFYGYDGTIHTAGRQEMLWHKVPLEGETVQVLPKERRVWRERFWSYSRACGRRAEVPLEQLPVDHPYDRKRGIEAFEEVGRANE